MVNEMIENVSYHLNFISFVSNNEFLLSSFNQCIDDGIFPDKLKMLKVVTICKKGSKDKYGNLRPYSHLLAM